jgi:(R,R)-butanediol dehydrogenase/meso-butanediol dehydrogenase/diacetyl reductase
MKETMKGIVYKGDQLAELREFPIPIPKKREVLVKTKSTTICGSDMGKWRAPTKELYKSYMNGKLPMPVLKTFPTEKTFLDFFFNLIQGHEGAGIVEEVGDAVEYLKKGDRVMMYHAQGCGVCPSCLIGNHEYCEVGYWLQATNVNGTFAEYVLNRETSVRKLPDFLSFSDGALMGCCAGTAFESLKKLGVDSCTNLVVYGLGPVGLCAVVEAKVLGARVIGVDVRKERLDFGARYGCAETIDGTKGDPSEAIRNLTMGKGADAAVETSGYAFIDAVKSVKTQGGRVCVVGLGKDRFEVQGFNSNMLFERHITGNNLYHIQSLQELMDLLVNHKVHLDQIVDTTFKLSQAQEAHEQFETYQSAKIGFVT